jgi:hypothetical protein
MLIEIAVANFRYYSGTFPGWTEEKHWNLQS